MSKFMQILLVACFAIALCAAEAPRRGATRFQPAAPRRSRVLARQEEAPAAVTPYPSAAELKPEVAFDEVESAQAPADAAAVAAPEHQPDQTYGPPEIETDEEPLAEEEEPAVEAEAPAVEEEAEAAPAAEDEAAVAEDEVAAEEEAQSERLVRGRRVGARKSVRPAKLRAAPKARSARLQQQPQFVAQPMFYYQPW